MGREANWNEMLRIYINLYKDIFKNLMKADIIS